MVRNFKDKTMQYLFPDFDKKIRTIMYKELLNDIELNNFFEPSSMLDSVVNCYQTILKETFRYSSIEYPPPFHLFHDKEHTFLLSSHTCFQ